MDKFRTIPLFVAISVVLYSFYKEPTIGHTMIALGFCAIYVFDMFFQYSKNKHQPPQSNENDSLRVEYEKAQLELQINRLKKQQVSDDTSGVTAIPKAKVGW